MAKTWIPAATLLLPTLRGRGKDTVVIIGEPPEPVWPNMSRMDFIRIGAALRWMGDQMGLRDWRLQMKWEPASMGEHGRSDCLARIEVLWTIKTANIWLAEDFVSMPEIEQRRALCHELLHIHLDVLMLIGSETCEELMGKGPYRLLAEEMHRTCEHVVESMAANWADTLDPIPASLEPDDNIDIKLEDGGPRIPIGEYLKRQKGDE